MEKVTVELIVERHPLVVMSNKLQGLGTYGIHDLETLVERSDYVALIEDILIQLGDQLRGI